MRPGCAGPAPGARKASPQKASPRPRKASPRKASHQKVQEVPPPGLKLAPQIEASAKPAAPSEGSSGASAGALEDTKLGGEVSSRDSTTDDPLTSGSISDDATTSEDATSTSGASQSANDLRGFCETPDPSEMQPAFLPHAGLLPLTVQAATVALSPPMLPVGYMESILCKCIGTGGQSKVYRYECPQRPYVIKAFKDEADPNAWQREIKALQAMRECENVVHLFGRTFKGDIHGAIHWEELRNWRNSPAQLVPGHCADEARIDFSRKACLLLEEAEGGPLYTLHNQQGLLSFMDKKQGAEVKHQTAIQLTQAVDAVHARQYSHLDIHPGQVHVKINFNGRVSVKLLDFGGAYEHAKRVQTNAIWGNCRYLWSMLVVGAPGVGDHFDVTADPDCYALAATVFFVLTGFKPYDDMPDYYHNGMPSCEDIWARRRNHIPGAKPEEIASLGDREPVADVLTASLITSQMTPAPAARLLEALQNSFGHLSA
jgi:hypothetical protein